MSAPATALDCLTAEQVAEFLQLPVRTVHEYAARGVLPCVPISPKHRRFLRSSIEQWLKDRERAAS